MNMMSGPVDVRRYKDVMLRLYNHALSVEISEDNKTYLRKQGVDARLERKLHAFEMFAPYLRPDMKILEWGCRHAIYSILVHDYLGGRVDLSGCDVLSDRFDFFYEQCNLKFSHLQHVYKMPYEDEEFDLVLSSGVLEHVALEHESCREVWRILKPDGVFIVFFLPNRYSPSENIGRWLGLPSHRRLYGLTEMRRAFLRRGFEPERSGYHQVLPALSGLSKRSKVINRLSGWAAALNKPLEKIWPINMISSNLYFVLRKRTLM